MERVARGLAEFEIEFETRICVPHLIRGVTPKGQYDIQVQQSTGMIRTTFVGRGENPLTHSSLLLRTNGGTEAAVLQRHVDAIIANERVFPWVLKETIPTSGDEIVRILPFGDDPTGPHLVVHKQNATGHVTMEVVNPRKMTPAEAVLISMALSRAATIANESVLALEPARAA